MNRKMQKVALIITIVLLIIFIPLTGGAIYFKFFASSQTKALENINKEFYFDNKLWFYDESQNLLGTYECETVNCGYAINWQADKDYAIDSYEPLEEQTIPIINNQFVFLKDFADSSSHEAFLYDIKSGTSFKSISYASVKNYGVGIEGNLFIVENAMHKYNVARLSTFFEPLFEFEYDFIGLINNVNEEDLILADYFVTLKSGMWNIMDVSGAILTEGLNEEIVSFNGSYIITRDSNQFYHLKTYQDELVLEKDFANLSFTDRYINCTTTENEFYVYDLTQDKVVGEEISIKKGDKVETKMNDAGNLDIFINEKKEKTIILS